MSMDIPFTDLGILTGMGIRVTPYWYHGYVFLLVDILVGGIVTGVIPVGVIMVEAITG